MNRRQIAPAALIAAVASGLLGEELVGPPAHIERGYGNQNWALPLADRTVLLKISHDGADVGKLGAAWQAQRLARSAGLPTGTPILFLERCEELGGSPVRLLEFIDGERPEHVLGTPGALNRFFASLGETIASLHAITVGAFSSRVDGSAPTFGRWEEYVDHRLAGVSERVLGTGVFSAGELRSLVRDIGRLADEVSPFVVPTLTHRDLYLDNILASPDGDVRALLDWDLAEAWDPLVDLVKLRWQVFTRYPGASHAFWRAYEAGEPPTPMRRERLHVVDVLELINAIANSRQAGWSDFEDQNRRHLSEAIAAFHA